MCQAVGGVARRDTMGSEHTVVGTCPECGASIPGFRVLIEYETDEGSDMFAECRECEEVVHPVRESDLE